MTKCVISIDNANIWGGWVAEPLFVAFGWSVLVSPKIFLDDKWPLLSTPQVFGFQIAFAAPTYNYHLNYH